MESYSLGRGNAYAFDNLLLSTGTLRRVRCDRVMLCFMPRYSVPMTMSFFKQNKVLKNKFKCGNGVGRAKYNPAGRATLVFWWVSATPALHVSSQSQNLTSGALCAYCAPSISRKSTERSADDLSSCALVTTANQARAMPLSAVSDLYLASCAPPCGSGCPLGTPTQ